MNVDSPEKYSIVLPRILTNFYKTIKRYERPSLRTVELYPQHSHVILANQVLDLHRTCLLYTSDAADDMQCVDLGGRRIIKKAW